MTREHCLTVWRELLDVVRLIDAVQTVTRDADGDQAVWRACVTALTERRTVLACVLSLEDPAQLDAVYAYLVAEAQGAFREAHMSRADQPSDRLH